jgi:hypothetical protein
MNVSHHGVTMGLMYGDVEFQSLLFTRPLAPCKVHNTPHLVEVVGLELVAIPEEKGEECNQMNLREVGQYDSFSLKNYH